MARHKNADWSVNSPIKTWDEIQVSLLMDIRDELQELNRMTRRVFECDNFLRIPAILDRISRNTAKPKRKKAKVGL